MAAVIRNRGDKQTQELSFGALGELRAFCELVRLGGYWDKFKVSAKHTAEGDITVVSYRGGFSRELRFPIEVVEQRDWLRVIAEINRQEASVIVNREPVDADRIMGVIRDGALN